MSNNNNICKTRTPNVEKYFTISTAIKKVKHVSNECAMTYVWGQVLKVSLEH